MGFTKRIWLHCNGNNLRCEAMGCEAQCAEGEHQTIADYKREMKANGWVFRKGNKAYCPVCKQDLQSKH